MRARRPIYFPALVLFALLAPAFAAVAQTVVTAAPDPAHEILSAAFQAETTTRSASPLTGGNALRFLENGVNSEPAKRALAAGAQRTLFVTTMNWDWDDCGRRFADDLIAAKRRGVDVRAIVDAFLS